MTKAVENFLHFSTTMRRVWTWFSAVYYRSSCLFVDSCWLLGKGCLTHPGVVESAVKDADTFTDKSELLQKPDNAKRLRDFIVSELNAGNGLRKQAKVVS